MTVSKKSVDFQEILSYTPPTTLYGEGMVYRFYGV